MSDATASEPSPPSDKLGLFLIGYGRIPDDREDHGRRVRDRPPHRRRRRDHLLGTMSPRAHTLTSITRRSGRTTSSPASTPYGDTETHFFGAHVTQMFDEHWGVGAVAGAVELASATDANLFSDGLRGGGGAEPRVEPVEDLHHGDGSDRPDAVRSGPDAVAVHPSGSGPPRRISTSRSARPDTTNGVFSTWYVTNDRAASVRVSLSYDTANYGLRDGAFAEFYTRRDTAARDVHAVPLRKPSVAARAEVTLQYRKVSTRITPASRLLDQASPRSSH